MRKSALVRNLQKHKSETTEQINLMEWIRREAEHDKRLKLAFHPENERKCSVSEGEKRKLMGVQSGVPDIVIPYPCGAHHGLFIELKYNKGRISTEQEEFLSEMMTRGYYGCVCYSKETAQEVIREYLKLQWDEMLLLLNEKLETGTVRYTKNGVPVVKPKEPQDLVSTKWGGDWKDGITSR